MDCLRSGLDVVVDAVTEGPVLAGRDGGVVCALKKSKPRRESAGFATRGVATSGRDCAGGTGRAEADDLGGSGNGSPPNKSTS